MSDHIPQWAARPATVLAAVVALAGAGLVFWAATTGNYWWAIWGGVCFAGAAALWYVGDLAGAPASPGHD